MSQYFYFWSEKSGLKGELGRSKAPGPTAPEFEFITGLTERVRSIAANTTHIFWSSDQIGGSPTPSINRSKADGTEVEKAWITFAGKFGYNIVVAIDGTYIYWAKTKGGSAINEIGRAKLDGSEQIEKFITLPKEHTVTALAVDGEHIYWRGGHGFGSGQIGRAKLDGSEVETEWVKISGEKGELAVNATHVYFSRGEGEIGRVKKNGTELEGAWIEEPSGSVQGLVATNTHLYYLAWNEGTSKAWLARVRISPKAEEAEWLSLGTIFGARTPQRLALSPEESPPPELTCPGPQTNRTGEPVTLIIESANTTEYKATGLPKGLVINEGTGHITGVPTTVEKVKVKLTVKGLGGEASCEFEWTIAEPETEEGVTDEWSYKGDPVHVRVKIPGAKVYKATGLPKGLTMDETGLITGTPDTLETTSVEVTAE